MNQCLQCQTETKNPRFCSRSCSATYTNSVNPKVRLTKKCKSCDNLIKSSRIYCSACRNPNSQDMTLKAAIYLKHHRSSAFALVRTRARAVAKNLGWIKCSRCPYDKHIEIAHIEPIKNYPLETLLSVINHPSNLLALCPNCHWEFDNL